MDAQTTWEHFYTFALAQMDNFYHQRYVTMITADPIYYTPGIKDQLRHNNRLMRAGRLEETSTCSIQVGSAIAKRNKSHLRDINARHGAVDLWRTVGDLTKPHSQHDQPSDLTPDDFNNHYASISTHPNYKPPSFKLTVNDDNKDSVSEQQIFYLLDHLHHTATGYEGLLSWYLRLAAPI